MFHDVFVNDGIVLNGVIAIVTGHAKGVGGLAGGAHHAVLREIAERIGVQVAADFVEAVICRHELGAIREIDAVDAGMHVGRATDEDVNLLCTGFLEAVDASFGSGAADDGVIDDNDAFPANEFLDEVEFDADVEVADEL